MKPLFKFSLILILFSFLSLFFISPVSGQFLYDDETIPILLPDVAATITNIISNATFNQTLADQRYWPFGTTVGQHDLDMDNFGLFDLGETVMTGQLNMTQPINMGGSHIKEVELINFTAFTISRDGDGILLKTDSDDIYWSFGEHGQLLTFEVLGNADFVFRSTEQSDQGIMEYARTRDWFTWKEVEALELNNIPLMLGQHTFASNITFNWADTTTLGELIYTSNDPTYPSSEWQRFLFNRNMTINDSLQVNRDLTVKNNANISGTVTIGDASEANLLLGAVDINWNGDEYVSEMDNTKMILYNEPNSANDFKVLQVFSKEAADVSEFVVTKAGDAHTSFFVRSLAIVGNSTTTPTPFNCSTYANHIDCKTDATGADFYVQDDIEANGSIYADEFFIGNGSQLTDTCLSDGTNCQTDLWDNTNVAYLNNTQEFTGVNTFAGDVEMSFSDFDLNGGLLIGDGGASSDSISHTGSAWLFDTILGVFNENLTVQSSLTAENICYSDGTNCSATDFDNTNVAYLNNTQTFTGNNTFNGTATINIENIISEAFRITGNETADPGVTPEYFGIDIIRDWTGTQALETIMTVNINDDRQITGGSNLMKLFYFNYDMTHMNTSSGAVHPVGIQANFAGSPQLTGDVVGVLFGLNGDGTNSVTYDPNFQDSGSNALDLTGLLFDMAGSPKSTGGDVIYNQTGFAYTPNYGTLFPSLGFGSDVINGYGYKFSPNFINGHVAFAGSNMTLYGYYYDIDDSAISEHSQGGFTNSYIIWAEEDDIVLDSDTSKISFGEDQDVNITWLSDDTLSLEGNTNATGEVCDGSGNCLSSLSNVFIPSYLSVTTLLTTLDTQNLSDAFDENYYSTYAYVNNSEQVNAVYNKNNGTFVVDFDGVYDIDLSIFLSVILGSQSVDVILKLDNSTFFNHNVQIETEGSPTVISLSFVKEMNAGQYINVWWDDAHGTILSKVDDGSTFSMRRRA